MTSKDNFLSAVSDCRPWFKTCWSKIRFSKKNKSPNTAGPQTPISQGVDQNIECISQLTMSISGIYVGYSKIWMNHSRYHRANRCLHFRILNQTKLTCRETMLITLQLSRPQEFNNKTWSIVTRSLIYVFWRRLKTSRKTLDMAFTGCRTSNIFGPQKRTTTRMKLLVFIPNVLIRSLVLIESRSKEINTITMS